MEIEKIERGQKLLEDLRDTEKKLSELGKSSSVDYIQIRRYSGYPDSSYEVYIRDDNEFKEVIKSIIEAKLMRTIKSLKKQISEI